MELNPIFRLELLQSRRNYILPAMFLGGCILMGISFFLPGLIQNWLVSPGFYWLIPLVQLVFSFLPFFIVLWVSLKFAAQQVNEDLILYTPLSPHRIFTGKILTALALMACFDLPGIPVIIWNMLFQDYGTYPIVRMVCGLLRTACWATIGLGFMAGARSMVMRAVMIAWAVLFMGGVYMTCRVVTTLTIRHFLDWFTAADRSHKGIYLVLNLSEVIYTTICLLAAAAIYFMGIQLFRGARNTKPFVYGTLIFAVVSVVAWIGRLLYLLSVNGIHPRSMVFGLIGGIFWFVLISIPLLAIYSVWLYDRRHKAFARNKPAKKVVW